MKGVGDMQIGLIGLGRMGSNIVRRLTRAGHRCVVFDRDANAIKGLQGPGITGAADLKALARGLEIPRVVWVMVPAGAPTEWTIAQVLSHLGSGAVIGRNLVDGAVNARTDLATPPDVWAEWDAKSPEAQAADAIPADAAFGAFVRSLDATQRRATVPLGPMQLPVDDFIGMRLSEHTLHTWDIEVALDPSARLHQPQVDVVSDEVARNRSPAARGDVIASRCRSATSRTSTRPNVSRGRAGTLPASSRWTMSSEVDTSRPSAGPRTTTGLTVVSSSPDSSAKAHAARSASVLDSS